MANKYWMWFFYSFKRQWKKSSFYMMLFLFIVLIAMVYQVTMPGGQSMKVLLYKEDAGRSDSHIVEKLCSKKGIFLFQETVNKEEMIEKIEKQEADCGFVFPADFQQRIEAGKLKKAVIYVSSPTTLRGFVVKEVFYAAFYEEYSKILLENIVEDGEIYKRKETGQLETLLEWNKKFLNDRSTFSFQYKNPSETVTSLENTSEEEVKKPVSGIFSLFLFFSALLDYGMVMNKKDKEVYMVSSGKRKKLLQMIEVGVTLETLAVIGVCFFSIMGAFGNFGGEILKVTVYVVICVCWAAVLSFFSINSADYLGTIPVIMLATCIITPAFFSTEYIISGFRLLKWIFPPTYYM